MFMELLENVTYLKLLVLTNFVSVLLLLTAWKFPRISRAMFAVMFLFASLVNWYTAINSPTDYVRFADYSIFTIYSTFIRGWWFRSHITHMVGFIASCQFVIAIGMLSKGNFFIVAATGAILFLLSIAPLGTGAAFPSTIIMAIAMYLLLRKGSDNYLWVMNKTKPGYWA